MSIIVSGCLATGPESPTDDVTDDIENGLTPVRDRHNLPFVTSGNWSLTLEKGAYGILDPVSVHVDVNVPLGNGLPVQKVHMGVFLPDVPEGTKVPVIADFGPYYGDGDVDATTPANRLGKFLIENLVPHGYAVAQASVSGTGKSVGCMDLMGEVEQAGIQAAVEWLGTQDWSNGNVGLIGRSYDGSTPWEAAMAGSSHLKTVVPISGLYGVHELMWRNGSAEYRGPGALWAIYYADAYSGEIDPETGEGDPALQAQQAAANTICPDSTTGGAQHVQTYVTGDGGAPEYNEYWRERSFREEVLSNYKGSVYFIHGLEDWNVDPHMAFPYYGELEAQGLEMKGLFGQWAHNYPDRIKEHEDCDGNDGTNGTELYCRPPESVRYDWAQDLLEWFDHYLKETGPQPELHVEVQGDDGLWRIEETWPPRDLAWEEITFMEVPSPVVPGGAPSLTPNAGLNYATEPLAEDLRLAGLPQLHLTVTPSGPGGQIFAGLYELKDGERRHVGHAVMDLRFAAGGNEPKPVVPGMTIVAKMEFEPMDALLAAGSVLEIRLTDDGIDQGFDYLPPAVNSPVVVESSDGIVLRAPAVERDTDAFFTPPGTA